MTTWNPADKGAKITLSNANRTAANLEGWNGQGVRSTTSIPVNSGLWYFEFDDVVLSSGDSIGLFAGTWSLGDKSGDWGYGLTLDENGATYGYNAIGSPVGHNVGIAVDMSTAGGSRRCWVRYDGGAWANGGDPVAGTNPYLLAALPMFIYARLRQLGSRATIRTASPTAPSAEGGGEHGGLHVPPDGYRFWDHTAAIPRTHSFIIGA